MIEVSETQFNGEADAVAHNLIREHYISDGEWYIICDLDEFHDLGCVKSFDEAAMMAEGNGASAISGILWDRVSSDGHLPETLILDQGLGKQFPMACEITKLLIKGSNNKILMAKKEVTITPGHHGCEGNPWNSNGRVHHFKWFGGIVEEAFRRLLSYEKQGLYYKHESQILYDYITSNGNKIPVGDQNLNFVKVNDDPFSDLIGIPD